MAKRIRIRKLAKEMRRSAEDVLAAAQAAGLPYTSASQQLSAEAEVILREKLKNWHRQEIKAASKPVRSSKALGVSDPLADSWMELAMQDTQGFQNAQLDREADSRLNRPKTHTKARKVEDLYRHFQAEPLPQTKARSERKKSIMPASQSIDAILKGLGFQGKSAIKSLTPHLDADILTLLKKNSLGPANSQKLQEAVLAAVRRSCGDSICERDLSAAEKPILLISDTHKCDACQGSNAKRSMLALTRALDRHRLTRVLVVGCRPNHQQELPLLLPDHIKMTLVYGGERKTRAAAKADLQWAEIAALWGPNIRQHRLSDHYKRGVTGAGRRIVHVEQRGIEALAQTLMDLLKKEKAPN